MNKMSKIFNFLKKPTGVFIVILYIVTLAIIAGVLAFVIFAKSQNVFAYILYALSAIFLSYSIYTIVFYLKNVKKKVTATLRNNNITGKLIDDYPFRTVVFALISVAISVGYAIFNGIIGLMQASIWFGALCGYYILLSVLKGGMIISFYKQNSATQKPSNELERNKLKAYLVCGIVLIVTILALSFAVSQMVLENKSFEYAGLMIYVGAAYTFTKLILAIINFVKAKKRKDTTVDAIRNVNLADAAVSILALQTAMFQAFANGENMGLFNAITGAAVCAVILSVGIFMIINAIIKLKKIK